MKRFTTLFLIICLCLLSGCGSKDEIPTEDTGLWVVTELTDHYGMNDQAQRIIEQFETMYPNVTVKLDILPTDKEAREVYLYKLRTQIMSGGGPDVYLMPTMAQELQDGSSLKTTYLEPLFPDVARQMYNGIFTDISEFYDMDDALRTEELVTAVMDAGVVNEKRYILPLRYSFDVILADLDALEELDIDPARLNGGLEELYTLALESENEYIAHALNMPPSQILMSQFIDHENCEVLMDPAEVENLIELWDTVKTMENLEDHLTVVAFNDQAWRVQDTGWPGYQCDITSFVESLNHDSRMFSTAGYPLYQMPLSDCVEAAAVIKQSGENIAMYPVRASGGKLVAEITYYGAIGSGSEVPELAYEFLRLFLSEEAQWEQYSPWNSERNATTGHVYDGWPVRSIGAVEPFYENIRGRIRYSQFGETQHKNYTYASARAKFIDESFSITADDIPVLSIPVDEARFPVVNSKGDFFGQHIFTFRQAEDVGALLDSIMQDLEWTLSES